MRQVFFFSCPDKYSEKVSSNVIIQPLFLFDALVIVLYQ